MELWKGCLLLLLVAVIPIHARVPPRFLTPFIPTITLNFLTALSTADETVIERANLDFRRLKSRGRVLTDIEQSLLVRRYSVATYMKIAGFEEAITRQFLTMPLTVQRAMDEILEDRTSLDFSNLEDPRRLTNYVILASDVFRTLKRFEIDALISAFPNYGLLLRDTDFLRVSSPEFNQLQQAQLYVQKLVAARRRLRLRLLRH